MVFSLAAGAIADSFNRRRVMLIAQFFMLCVSASLAVAAWFGVLTPWSLLAFTFLIGCGTALNNPSWQASVGDVVPRSLVPAAVILNSVAFNITRSVGPAIGGAIVAAAGAAAAFAVNTLTYLPLIVVLLRWRPSLPASTLPRESLGIAMGAGIRYVAMSPSLLKVLARAFAFGACSIAVLALLPLVAQSMVGGGPLTFGALLGAFGVGAVASIFFGARLRAALSSEGMVRAAFAAFALCAAVCAVSRWVPLTAVGLFIGGGAWVTALSLFNTIVQLSTPRWVVGRALSLYQAATFGGMALGSWLWGLVAEERGLPFALSAAAVALVAGGALGLRIPLPRLVDLNLDPLNRFREPTIAIDMQPRSGPIAVLIEYRIGADDLQEFLGVMTERHRIRRRDGARHWTLMRDLEDAELWYESYQTPTFTEYVRHNTRPTLADAAVGDRLRALHRGPDRPRVHRMIVRQAGLPRTEHTVTAPIDIH
jgi:MFS family permease